MSVGLKGALMKPKLAAAFLLAVALAAGAGALPRKGRCVRVVDGDTLIVLAGGRKHAVRLIGVDTPEKHDSAKLREEARRTGKDAATIRERGQLASTFTALAVQEKKVELEYDRANSRRGHKDDHRRLLAYVWFHSKGKRTLLNGRIIAAGYGIALTRYSYAKHRKQQFLAAERVAQRRKQGLWASTLPELPEPEIHIVGNLNSKIYHSPDCLHAKRMHEQNKAFFPDAKAAKAAGFRACKVCGGE